MYKRIFSYFENLIPPFQDRKGECPPQKLIPFILYYSKGLLRFFIAVALLNSLIAVGEALFFVCLGMIVDWTVATPAQSFLSEHGRSLFVMLIIAGVLLPVASVLHSLLIHQTLSGNYSMLVRWIMHSYLLNQSLSFFTQEFAGGLANKVMQTSLAVRTAMIKLIDVAVHLVVYVITMLVMLNQASIYLCIPLALWLVIYVTTLLIFIPRLRKASKEQSDRRSVMVGRIVDSYTNIATVKIFGGHGKESEYARASMNDFREAEYGSLRILTLFDVSVQFINYTLLICIIMASLWLWSNYIISSGAIAVSAAIAIRMINMSRWIMWEAGAIFENIGMIYDGMHTISRPIEVEEPEKPVRVSGFEKELTISNISFSYKGNSPLFNGLNLSIKKGEKIGIVGHSGAGKSTLVSLLLRFYDVDSGQIMIDGTDIRKLKQDDLRDLFSIVCQDSSLLHRTVAENMAYGTRDDINEKQLYEVAKATDSLNFIENLSDYRGNCGFDSMVGDRGVKLSGGQRQKIAIARVLLRNAPILILDEATSALDSESEKIILENLDRMMEGRTVIAIAHRLSTLKKMDKIIVIDKGRIVQQGSHEDLICCEGIYKKMWSLQSDLNILF
ncbi:MAG: ABC transporter ATP-binding protein [Succinivibrio sp.]